MKSVKITKRQLKEDELLHATLAASGFVQTHLKTIGLTILGLGVVAGLVAGYQYYTTNANEEASKVLFQANNAFQKQSYAEAVKFYEQLQSDYSRTQSGKDGLILMANAYYKTGDYDKAIEAYKECVSRYPGNDFFGLAAREGIAESLESKGSHKEAAEKYEEIAERYAHKTITPRNLLAAARAYQAAGDTDKAKKACQTILDKYADSPEKTQAENRLATLNLMAGN